MRLAPAHDDGARLAALLTAGGARARAEGRAILVSLTRRSPAVDPLAALEHLVREAAAEDRLAAHAAAGRMYWTRADDGFALAGFGAVATFTPTGPDRFAAVDRAWTALLDSAITDDASGGAFGPLLMGGFAFDPDGPRTETWRGFPSAHLIVPRLLIVRTDDECWVTISALVGSDGVPDVSADELAALCRRVLPASAAPPRTEAKMAIDPPGTGLAFSSPVSASAWQGIVESALSAIGAGELQKIVLARELRARAPRDVDVFATLRHLRAVHRDCFVFGYWRGERAFVGASPERLVRLVGRQVRASSLAGSARRGTTPEEDAALAAALMGSEKDWAEHAAVRDALHDGLAELCDDISAADVPSLLTLRHVHHLHTAIDATLRRGRSLLDLVARLHPTPAVGGTPRDAALRFIRGHERLDRGWYAAPIGWVGRRGGDFAVALRSAVISGSTATLYAGCGIVADSVPELELAESQVKLRSMQAALAAALGELPTGAAGVVLPAERAS
jgi:isochorismate synthase